MNGRTCVEFKSAPMLSREARLLEDFRRSLAGNQSAAWAATPEALREPCALAVDVQAAGVEYSQGLALGIRYWDGRSRVYQGHLLRGAEPDLFELPVGYSRTLIGKPQAGPTGKPIGRQPSPSQRK